MASSSRKQPLSDRPSSSTAGSSSSAKGKMSTGDDQLDALVEVFPQLNFLTLVEVCMEYKNDIDGAADYIIHNVLPSILDENSADANEDSHMKGPASVDNNARPDPIKFDITDNKDDLLGESLMQLSRVESSGQDYLLEGSNCDCLVASAQNSKPETSAFDDDLATHDDELPELPIESNYSARLESLDNLIADENYKKVTLMSNVAALSQMLVDTELKEDKLKQAVLEASQAGNDISVKVEELKEMTMLATEENDKVAGEVSAEQSILTSEAQGLQARLSNISKERNNYVLIIEEMRQTLQRRLLVAETKTLAAEIEKVRRETLAEEMLNEHELLLDATKERSKKLEQQAQENIKLRELLMDRGQVVDALQGEMVGIFDKISQLQLGVHIQLPKPLQGSSSMSYPAKSADNTAQLQCRIDEPRLSDEQLQLASARLSSSSIKLVDNIAQAHYRVDEPQLHVDEPQLPAGELVLPVDEPSKVASSSLSNSLKSSDNIAHVLGRLFDVHFPIEDPLQLNSSSLCSSVKSSDNIEHRVDVDESLHFPLSILTSSEKSVASKSSSAAADSEAVFSDDEEIDDASSQNNFALDDSWDVVDA
ncbi:hypothetical protein E2562_002169 [Oryza meyeriana var. granulata]|uniref:CUE domain-containing protein n=1 Tax=Oryza meyeriana var. granulata TaxID=110450 RepID=A0A6G1EEU2_9ORYZ|nr:hypothetical protein E2562_002169 [Oryza meyeriana var. granulata]